MIVAVSVEERRMREAMETMARLFDPSRLVEIADLYGLTPDQAVTASEALRPALAAAIRRRAADPRGLAEMMGLVKPKPDLAAAMPGGEALGRLFGSRELTAAIIDRIAETTGTDKRSLEILLPLASEAVMAQFSDNLKSHPLTEGLGTLIAPRPRAAPTLDEILTDTLGAETANLVGRTLEGTPNPLGPTNLFGEMLGEFLRGFNNGGPPPEEAEDPAHAREVVDRLFEAGRDAQAEQIRSFEAMIDRWWKEGPHTALSTERS